jgi:acetyl esterase/lipase
MRFLVTAFFLILHAVSTAQTPDHVLSALPEGTIIHSNIAYAGDTLKKHLLDLYLPVEGKENRPLVIWIHGGGWRVNDKYADMGYMKNTIRNIVKKGYALASIDYRYSTTAVFPAQMKDCMQAVQFLYDNAQKYKVDRSKFVLMGFSSGGHLASLLALSLNNNVIDFYPTSAKPSFRIAGVLDFYGPSDLLLFYGHALPGPDDSSIGILLGASPVRRPDLAKKASPVNYVDKNDPPFFIVHGELDDAVPPTQSHLLKSWLDVAGVKNDIHVVKGAPHFGEMFDTEEVQQKLFAFLSSLKF